MIYVEFGCRAVLAMVFLFAAANKLRGRHELAEFNIAVSAFGVPAVWSWPIAVSIVALELAVAIAVAFDVTAGIGLCMAASLLLCFSVAIASALSRGVSTSCRCFGASTRPLGVRHIVRNAILLLITAAASAKFLLSPPMTSADSWNPAFMVLAAFSAVVVALLLIAFEDLAALVQPPESKRLS